MTAPPRPIPASRPIPAHRPLRTPPRRRSAAIAAVAAALLGAALLTAAPAQAHDALISTNPADKSTVQAVPATIVLHFEEPPLKTGSQVLVKGPSGDVASGAPVFADDDVTQAVQPGAPAGTYTVTWRVTSDDAHPVFGSFTFTATAAGAGSPAGATPAPAAAADPAPAKTSGWWWLLLLLLLVPVGLLLARRSRSSSGRST